MGLSNSKPASKKNLTIHIKKAVVKDNHIYLFDKHNIAKVIVDNIIRIKNQKSSSSVDSIGSISL